MAIFEAEGRVGVRRVEAARRIACNAQPCASAAEIADALGVALMVNAGTTLVYSARTIDAFHASESQQGT
jgi:hypothetical protein